MAESMLGAAFLALFVAVVAHVRRQRRINLMLRAGRYPRVED